MDTIAGGSYGECPYAKIAEKLQKISRNNRGGKQTIDPPMPSNEKKVRKDDDKVVKGSGEAEESTGKDAEESL